MAKSKSTPGKAKTEAAAPVPVTVPSAAVSAGRIPVQPEYTVVARRYRPQQLSDLIGQEHVALALTNAIRSGRLAHAYLFTGARGTGKTSTARILAKALNCEKGPTPTPCDQCEICRSVAAGDDIDVMEIDGASNNGVENVRELRQNVVFRPSRARYKIYIIDEVHMLSTGAFNALLKTLEEPPPHVKFIFATTEVNKIPITILSRCQRFDFSSITTAKIFATLQHIVRKEGLEADDEALQFVARRAAGSLRDAQTLLDQLLGSAEGRLTAARVQELFGTAGEDQLRELARAILAGNAASALQQLAAAQDRGLQAGELLDQLVDYWRCLLLASVGGAESIVGLASETRRAELLQQVQGVPLDQILAGIDVLTACKAKMRGTSYGQVLIESAIVRLCHLADLLSTSELAQWLRNSAPDLSKLPVMVERSRDKTPAAGPAMAPAVAPAVAPTAGQAAQHAQPSKKKPSPEPVGLGGLSADSLQTVWRQVLVDLGSVFEAFLTGPEVSLAISGPNSLAIRFAAEYTTAYEYTRNERNLELLKKAFRTATGVDVALRVELAPPDPAAAPDPGPAGNGRPNPLRRHEILQLPFFKAAADLLGAQLLKVDEGFDPLAAALGSAATESPASPVGEDDDETASLPTEPEEE